MQPLGDSAVLIQLGATVDEQTHLKVRLLSDYLGRNPFPGMLEYVPAFTTVTVYYDYLEILRSCPAEEEAAAPFPHQIAVRKLRDILNSMDITEVSPPRVVDIPVCYGGEYGPDLDEVAERNAMSPAEVIRIHASGEYLVYMLGFAPGFPYLGGMSPRIAAPRRPTPRLNIPAGSVGIAGGQTGVYPIETPGGWQLIGRTPAALFLPERTPPTLLEAGNRVRFYPISRSEYDRWEGRT